MPQSLAKVYLHAIFSTENREPVLADEWRNELFEVLGGTANNLGCQSLIVGGVADHVHMLFQLGRTIAIADAIGKIKSTSSAWVNQTRGLSAPFHWQGGYAIFSVSQSNVEAVREYIRTQPKHHAKQSFGCSNDSWSFVWAGSVVIPVRLPAVAVERGAESGHFADVLDLPAGVIGFEPPTDQILCRSLDHPRADRLASL